MRLSVLLICCGLAAPAAAQDMTDTCSHAADIAATIMKGRQNGVPAAQMVKTTVPMFPPQSQRLARDMVLAAYQEPRYNTADYANRAISDFSDIVFVSCMGS